MSAVEHRVKELLGSGLSNEVVANAVGLHPSRISQLMSDESFASEVAELRTKALLSHTIRDQSYDGIEDSLLGKLRELVDQNMIYKSNDVLHALRMVNQAKRRGNPAQDAASSARPVVTLNLPVTILNKFKMNAQGEVVEVITQEGSQSLVTMPAATLMSKLLERRRSSGTGAADASAYAQVSRFLPPSSSE